MIVLAGTSITSKLYRYQHHSGLADWVVMATHKHMEIDMHQLQLPYFLVECIAFLNATYWNVHTFI